MSFFYFKEVYSLNFFFDFNTKQRASFLLNLLYFIFFVIIIIIIMKFIIEFVSNLEKIICCGVWASLILFLFFLYQQLMPLVFVGIWQPNSSNNWSTLILDVLMVNQVLYPKSMKKEYPTLLRHQIELCSSSFLSCHSAKILN